MEPFLGSHQSRLDAKGRVSVPAAFRLLLKAHDESGALIFRPSITYPCIEAVPVPAFQILRQNLDGIDPFSDDYEDMALSLHGAAYPAEPDKEGRVLLSETMIDHAHLRDSVMFIGAGNGFQIWEPVAGVARLAAARERARRLQAAKAAG